MNNFFVLTLFILFTNFISAQNIYLPINNNLGFSQSYNYFEEKIYADTNSHTSVKPYITKSVTDLPYTKKGIKHFSKDSLFFISASPIITLTGGKTKENTPYDFEGGISLNTFAGKKISGQINISQKITRFSNYRQTKITPVSIPHYGSYTVNNDVYSYSNINGYISFSPDKYFNFQFGKYKNFLGDGYRSLLYSDNSSSNWFLKGSVNVWHIKYIVIYNYIKDIDCMADDYKLRDKYNTTHFLSWNIGRWFNLNLFETVVWRGSDSLGYRGYDVNYLNPIVFYRPVEFSLGSPDNVIMGGGFKIKVRKNNHIYGQFLLDEFKLEEIKAKNGWWANKYGFQFGAKTYNLLNIKHLFALAEYNRVRPFTYSHGSSMENWGNNMQALAHPLGSNFTEYVAILRYSHKKSLFRVKFVNSLHGTDNLPADSINYGGNIYRSYNDGTREYGNYQNQGYVKTFTKLDISYTYLFKPEWNMGLEAGISYLRLNENNDYFIHFGIKTYMFNEYNDF